MKKFGIPLLLALSCGMVIFVVTSIFLYLYYPLELKTYDLRILLKTRKYAHDEIVIVDIDDYSIKKLGRFRNWPRWYYASVIEYLGDQNVKIIGVDMLLPEPDTLSEGLIAIYQDKKEERVQEELRRRGIRANPRDIITIVLSNMGFDPELMRAIQRTRKVILPLAIIKSSDEQEGDVEAAKKFSRDIPLKIRRSLPDGNGIAVPTRMLMQGVKDIGVVNTDSDIDGIIRKIPLFYRFEEQVYPSFAFTLFLHAYRMEHKKIHIEPGKNVRVGTMTIPVDDEVRMPINFLGNPFSFRYIPFYDVLMQRVGEGFFREKIVLIGSSAVALSDLKPTPASRNMMPGVEVHANALYTLINNSFIHYPTILLTLILILGIAIVTTSLASYLKPWLSLLLTVIVFIGFLVACDLLFDTKNIWLEIVRPSYTLVLSYIVAIAYRFAVAERSKRELRRTFDRYVSREVVEQIISNPDQLKLGGERKDITVLFSDIRGFTSMSESMQPEEVVGILNDYLTTMTDIILEYGGTIDKFIGDAIMAVFGAPIPYADHTLRAAKASLRMRDALKTLWLKWTEEQKHPFDIGIGISTGEAIVGNIGSVRRTEYTAIGDIVNLGARIEPLNKEYNTHILISEAVYERIKDFITVSEIGQVRVRGKKHEVRLFELTALKEQ
jgi:adenylate cyclase